MYYYKKLRPVLALTNTTWIRLGSGLGFEGGLCGLEEGEGGVFGVWRRGPKGDRV